MNWAIEKSWTTCPKDKKKGSWIVFETFDEFSKAQERMKFLIEDGKKKKPTVIFNNSFSEYRVFSNKTRLRR
jgi:hypothetical protein